MPKSRADNRVQAPVVQTLDSTIHRILYMAARRYEFYLPVLKVSLTSEQSEGVRDTFSSRR